MNQQNAELELSITESRGAFLNGQLLSGVPLTHMFFCSMS